jgi:NitT/TauT family transport system substrate-binding protein
MNGIKAFAVAAIAIIAVLGIVFFSSEKTAGRESVRIGFMPITADYQYFVAKEKGFFEQEGLNVEEVRFASSNLMLDALAQGNIDVIASAAAPTAYIIEEKSPGTIKIFAYTDDNNLPALIVKKEADITRVSDLQGKKIGSFPGTTAVVVLKSVLSANGVDLSSVEIQEMAPQLQLQALAAGQVDALYAYEPTPTLGELKGVSEYLRKRPAEFLANPLYMGFSGVSGKFAREKPETVEKIVRAFKKADDFIKANDAEGRRILANRTNLPQEAAAIVPLSPFVLVREMNETQEQEAQAFADFFAETGIILGKKILARNMWVS